MSKELEKLARLLQLLVKLEATDEDGLVKCIDCDTRLPPEKMQGGHYIPRSCVATKIDPRNIHPQAPACNLRMSKGDTLVFERFRAALIAKIGEAEFSDLLAIATKGGRASSLFKRQGLQDLQETTRTKIHKYLPEY